MADAITTFWYPAGLATFFSTIWVSDTIKIKLCTSSSNAGSQESLSNISAVTNEVTGVTGYTSGGATLSNKTATVVTASNLIKLDADDVTWTVTPGTLTCRYAVIYHVSSGAVLGCIDFGQDKTDTSGTFGIVFTTSGALPITYIEK